MGLTEKLLLLGICKLIEKKLNIPQFKLLTMEIRGNIVNYSVNLGPDRLLELDEDDINEIEEKLGFKITKGEILISRDKLISTFTDEKGEKKVYTIRS